MKVYHFPGTRSSRVVWMANELGVDLEIAPINLQKGEHKGAPYLSINPHGSVPTYVDEARGIRIVESIAICLHLLDEAGGDALIPPRGTAARAAFWQWMVYAVSELDGLVIGLYFQIKFRPADHPDKAKIPAGLARWNDVIAPFLVAGLGDSDYLCGDEFTAADVAVGYDIALASGLGLLDDYPTLAAYAARVTSRPGFAAAHGRAGAGV